MIVVLDSRRPSSLDLDVNLRLEAYLENSKRLISQCCSLGRLKLVEAPTGLIVPRASPDGKMVQVVCRERPVTAADLSRTVLVDVHENGYGDGFGWKFLVDAALTATRIRGDALEEMVILTTDLVLVGEDSENEAHFFETASASSSTSNSMAGHTAAQTSRISVVFVEVVGSSCASIASDSLTAWNELQRLREGVKDRAYTLDLIENTTAMFDSQLRCWLRDSSARQACSLRLPATETFSGVAIEVDITHYLLSHDNLSPRGSSPPALHKGFSSMRVLQRVPLQSLDQGLCRGDPLLCIPSQLRGSPQHSQANRRLFMAVCTALNRSDMGLLLAVQHPSTSLEERWLLLPQVAHSADPASHLGSSRSRGLWNNADAGAEVDAEVQTDADGCSLVDKSLLVRLAMKEDVLEESSISPNADGLLLEGSSDFAVERAAASASLEVLEENAYNPLQHSSGLFKWLAYQPQQPQQLRTVLSHCNTVPVASRAASKGNSQSLQLSSASEASSSASRLSRGNRQTMDGIGNRMPMQQRSLSKPVSTQRRATIGGAGTAAGGTTAGGSAAIGQERGEGRGRAGREGSEGQPQHQQLLQRRQPNAKTREVRLRYAEPSQHQQHLRRERGKTSPLRGSGSSEAQVSGGMGRGDGDVAVASGGRSSKRRSSVKGGRGNAAAEGKEREGSTPMRGSGASRRRGAADVRHVDESMML